MTKIYICDGGFTMGMVLKVNSIYKTILIKSHHVFLGFETANVPATC